jgi:hypothetical protein
VRQSPVIVDRSLPIDQSVAGKYHGGAEGISYGASQMTMIEEQEWEDKIELLQQKLQALTGSSQELGVLISLRHGMTNRLATMLYILVNRAPAVVSRSAFHTFFYGDRLDGGPEPKIFNVHISRLRGVLKRLGCEERIDTVWNAGFRASPGLVKWVKERYAEHIPST